MLARLKRKPKNEGRRVINRAALPSTFSYHANRLRTEQATGRTDSPVQGKSSQRPSLWYLLPSILAGAAIVICLGYVLTLTINPKIVMTTTTDQPSLLRSTQTYQDAARTVLSHSIFSRTKLTISTSGIAAELRKQFPELQEVGVSLPLLNRRPVITLVPATAALILTDTQGNRFVVSDKGQTVIAVRDAQNVDGMHLPIINDTSTTTLQNKQNVLTASEVGFVQTILAELTAKQLKPSSLSLPATPSELDIKLEGLDYLVKFNMQTDGRQAVGTFLAVKNQLDKTNQKPAEYIDVRVEERAYYK